MVAKASSGQVDAEPAQVSVRSHCPLAARQVKLVSVTIWQLVSQQASLEEHAPPATY